jgi:hypothetical protein
MSDLTNETSRKFSELTSSQRTMLVNAFRQSADWTEFADWTEDDVLEEIADDLFHSAVYGARPKHPVSEAEQDERLNWWLRGREIQAAAQEVLGFRLKV